MFIFKNKENNKLYYIETFFSRKNFLHLTGLKYNKGSKDFFSKCLKKTISPKDISIKSKVYTKSKLKVLENAMSINKVSNRIGAFNYNGIKLRVDKVIGGNNYCIGFSNKEKNGKIMKYYYPKSLLKANIKDYTLQDNKIIAIFSKERNYKYYSKITYIANGIKILEFFEFPNIIKRMNHYVRIQC